ncbi:NAD/NADP-dependent octopine/nopaline dehydrogenase family protein [Aureimonas populi]|uniref:NAD/NADP octopine/nopaline dehydrogenase family protein n=1 Tax=Aureimonas populi TaxID=1701758 RepID=A0ABW5CH23_9HYPH|nr:NAD/NADP-dependent octopine/nopaline dehydrogenase family protein [Aureimonas populi]
MRIAVLGGGNGSFAAAADFSLAGHEVTLWRRGAREVAEHEALGRRIVLRDRKGRREAVLARVTDDIAAAVSGARYIIAPLPATTHEELAQRLAPHLRPGQVVHLPPGTLGTLVFARAAQAAGTASGVAFAESGTLPWLVRKHGFAEIVVSGRATRLPTGVFPSRLADHALGVIEAAFPGCIVPCGGVLSGALMNAGPVIHPPLIVMNAGPLEHFEAWDIHNEGTQPAIRRVTDALDAERMALREALGYGAPHFPLADHYSRTGEEWMYGRGSHDELTDSGDWREKIVLTEHRYVLEDIGLGLSLLCSVAAMAGVEVPVARGLLALGSIMAGRDFALEGRPLGKLGLAALDRAELQAFLAEGYPS